MSAGFSAELESKRFCLAGRGELSISCGAERKGHDGGENLKRPPTSGGIEGRILWEIFVGYPFPGQS